MSQTNPLHSFTPLVHGAGVIPVKPERSGGQVIALCASLGGDISPPTRFLPTARIPADTNGAEGEGSSNSH